MLPQPLARLWLRNKRRVLSYQAGVARRRLRGVRTAFYHRLWEEAAATIGAALQERPNGLLQISTATQATFVSQSDLMLDSELTLRMMANKALTYELIAKQDVRLPAHVAFNLNSLDRAMTFLEGQTGPVVVKPADGTGGGRGVTTGVSTKAALISAARHAAGFNTRLLAEEQLSGSSFRLLYFDGEFLDAVRRDSPVVTGDGRSTVANLVKRENAARQSVDNVTALSPLLIDQEARNTLAAQSIDANHVPKKEEQVRVKLAVNENGSAQNHIVRRDVNPEIVEAGARLVRAFGIKFAGLDVTADDIAAPVSDPRVIFNEINVNPGIHHHYLVANPEQSADVASKLLENMFRTKQGTIDL